MNAFLFLYSGSFLGHIFLMRENRRIRLLGRNTEIKYSRRICLYAFNNIFLFTSWETRQSKGQIQDSFYSFGGWLFTGFPSFSPIVFKSKNSVIRKSIWLLKSRDDTSIFPLQVSFCAMAFYSQLQLTQLLPYNPIIAILFIFSGIQLVFLFFFLVKNVTDT